MQEFLYGKLNSETIIKQYTSVESSTLKLYIDNKKNLLSGEVLRTPGTLSIKMSGSILGTFNGSQNVNIEIPPLVLDKSDTETADIDLSQDGTHLQVNVKKVPNKLIINKADGSKQEYDGGAEVEISLGDDILARVDELDSQINDIASIVDSKAPSSDVDVIADNVAVNTVDIEGIKDNTTLIQHETGSFFAVAPDTDTLNSSATDRIAIGNGAHTINSQDIIIGKNAKQIVSTDYKGSVRGIAIGASAQISADGIAIGPNAVAKTSIAIGAGSGQNNYLNNVMIGDSTKCSGAYSIAIGYYSKANAYNAIAIASSDQQSGGAQVSAKEGIQLGIGKNINGKTLQIWEHQLLDGNTGKIPDERLSDNILKANAQTLTTAQQTQVKENLGVNEFTLKDLPKFINKIRIDMSKKSGSSSYISIPIVSSNNLYVDWGDNTFSTYASTSSLSHTYPDKTFNGWIIIYGDFKGINVGNVGGSDPQRVITGIIYDNNITQLPTYGITSCSNLTTLHLPDSLTTIGGQSLGHLWALNKLELPQSVTTISGWRAFEACSFTTIDLPPKLTSIPARLTQQCSKMLYITIPQYVESIGSAVFYACDQLRYVYMEPLIVPSIQSDAFLELENIPTIFVPSSSLRDYKIKTNWTLWADKIYPKGGNYSETITISANSWDSATSTVIVEAVGATTEARNIIEWFTSKDNAQVENTYGLNCTEQGTMSLTFTCETIPSEDVQVSVRYTLTNY